MMVKENTDWQQTEYVFKNYSFNVSRMDKPVCN